MIDEKCNFLYFKMKKNFDRRKPVGWENFHPLKVIFTSSHYLIYFIFILSQHTNDWSQRYEKETNR